MGFWWWPRRRNRRIPAAGYNGGANAGHRQRNRHPEILKANGTLAALFVGHPVTRASLLAPRHRAICLETGSPRSLRTGPYRASGGSYPPLASCHRRPPTPSLSSLVTGAAGRHDPSQGDIQTLRLASSRRAGSNQPEVQPGGRSPRNLTGIGRVARRTGGGQGGR